jgi:hypothetical protein
VYVAAAPLTVVAYSGCQAKPHSWGFAGTAHSSPVCTATTSDYVSVHVACVILGQAGLRSETWVKGVKMVIDPKILSGYFLYFSISPN